jgi:hypothetical protein
VDFAIRDFAMDPSQDLLVLMEVWRSCVPPFTIVGHRLIVALGHNPSPTDGVAAFTSRRSPRVSDTKKRTLNSNSPYLISVVTGLILSRLVANTSVFYTRLPALLRRGIV